MLKITLCDVHNHPTPILLDWDRGLTQLGHKTTFLPIPQNTLYKINWDVDVLIYSYAGANRCVLNEFKDFKKKNPKTKIVIASSEWNDKFIYFKGIVDFFVAVIDSHPTVKNIFNFYGFEWHNIRLAGNDEKFYKIPIDKIYDACFIGNLSHGYRGEDKFLYPILDNPKYKCFLGGIKYKSMQNGFVPYAEHNKIRNLTKINLNFHVPYQKLHMGVWPDRNDCNNSVFNIALCGNFQLCDNPLAAKYFDNNVVVADETTWLETFEYYLNSNNEREEKAKKAMVIAQKFHTWKVRMEEFISILNKTYEQH